MVIRKIGLFLAVLIVYNIIVKLYLDLGDLRWQKR